MSLDLETGLAATKLQPPTLPNGLVARPRLDQRLDACVDGPANLMLVSAPAGSGKSILLASWLDGRREASAWLQVEESDVDPTRFWTYLLEAIGRVQPSVLASVGATIAASKGNSDVIVSALVTALASESEPLIVVLDDYHLINGEAVHQGVERLIDLCPSCVTVVVSARFDPPFRLGRLRVQKRLVEIRFDDLRFVSNEASGLLGVPGQRLDETEIDVLFARTEGWAAGLVLAGLSLEHSDDPSLFIEEFHGDDKMVVEYLGDEFLSSLNDGDRDRLLAMSILENFNGALVDVVAGSTDGRQWLSRTAATNQLLIGLDRTGKWFRFHHLLRDLLRLEASETIPEQLPALHGRAASWFASNGDERHAIHHWIAADDRTEAGQIMRSYGQQLIVDGQFQTLRRTLEDLGDVARSMPWCTLMWGWCDFVDGRYAEAEAWVQLTHDTASATFDQVITTPLRMNIFLGQGDVNSALVIATELTKPDVLADLAPERATVAGGVLMWAGKSTDARMVLEIAIAIAAQDQANTPHALALIYLAIVAFETGDASTARLAVDEALDVATGLGLESFYRNGPLYAIRARTSADDVEALADALKAVDAVRATPGDLALAYVLTMCGDTLIDLGDSRGSIFLTEARSVVDRCVNPGMVGQYLDRVESRHGVEVVRSVAPTGLVVQLTERETAVLRYLPTKLSQREIAAELFVSLNTVKSHSSAIYRKLAVDGRKAAVQAARDLNIL